MSVLRGVVGDLRDKRLWLLAAALLVALIAIPLLAGGGGRPGAGAAPSAVASAGGSSAPALPAVQVSSVAGTGRVSGRERNPFAQRGSGSASSSTTPPGGQATGQASGGSGGAAATHPATTTSTGSSGGSSTGQRTTTPKLPGRSARPAPRGLGPTETYRVTFAITNATGGFDTANSLERLSPIPNAQEPLLIELGVLEGGRRVLFAVEPGAVLSGPGQCIPGRISCQLLALSPGQVESLSEQTALGVRPVDWFAVAAIGVAHHPSRAAAAGARRTASAAGRRLLARTRLSALSLFSYDARDGAVIDLRNLTVGGS